MSFRQTASELDIVFLGESLESVACFPTTSLGTQLSILDVGSAVTKVMLSNQISPYLTPHNIGNVPVNIGFKQLI